MFSCNFNRHKDSEIVKYLHIYFVQYCYDIISHHTNILQDAILINMTATSTTSTIYYNNSHASVHVILSCDCVLVLLISYEGFLVAVVGAGNNSLDMWDLLLTLACKQTNSK